MCWQPVTWSSGSVSPAVLTAVVTAPQRVWPRTRISLAPATAQAYSMLPSTCWLATLPAMRTLKMSPRPMSKINSAGLRESMQLKHDGQRMLPGGRGPHLADQVASQPFAAAETLVALLEDLEHLLRVDLALQLARRVVDVLHLVAQI